MVRRKDPSSNSTFEAWERVEEDVSYSGSVATTRTIQGTTNLRAQRNDLKIESKNHVPVRLFGKVPRVFLVRDRAVLGVRFDARERHGGGGWVRSVGWEVREGGTRGVELLWRKKKQKVPRCI